MGGAKGGRWVTKGGRWVSKGRRWVAKAALCVQIHADISQKYKIGDISKGMALYIYTFSPD